MSANREYDSGHNPEQEVEQYAFLEERIKDDAFNGKKAAKKIARTLGLGLVFGTAACMSFFVLKPWAESLFKRDPQQVEIPEDEEVPAVKDEEPVEGQESVLPELTIEDYQALNYEMSKVAAEAQKSMVNILGTLVSDNPSKTQEEISTAGVIVADNGEELLILADGSALKNAKKYTVKFTDNTEYKAELKQKSGNSGMGIFAVKKNAISDTTWARIEVAELGNSNALGKGKTMIALGNLYGYENGMAYGISSSVDQRTTRADGGYSIIVTDISGNVASNGVLFDIHGNVVGMIGSEVERDAQSSVIVSYGISSLKSEIELMSNGKAIPYLGIIGVVVTEKTAAEENIPEGLYVMEVEPESPAMNAGIQSGDIITHIENEEIATLAGYRSELMKKGVGEELRLTGKRLGADDYVGISFNAIVGKK